MARFQGEPVEADARKPRFAGEVPTPSLQDAELPSPPANTFDVGKIPESAAYGTLYGLATPEILKGAGKVAGVFPATRALAPMLEVAGEAARGRRGAGAVAGGFAAGTGESAAQAVKAFGGGPVLQESARFATEVLAPAGVVAAGRNFPFTRGLLRDISEGGYKEAGERFAARIRGPAATEARQAQEAAIAALEREAAALRAEGSNRANQILQSAEAQANVLAPTNAQRAAEIRQAARTQANNILADVDRQIAFRRAAMSRARAEGQRAERIPTGTRGLIGEPREATEVGTALRDRITEVQGQRLKAREAQIKADKEAVRADVDAKQAAGQFVSNQPQYQALLRDLEQRLGIGRAGAESPLKAETDPGIKNALSSLYNALKKRRSETADGQPVEFPIGFDAIDNVRRRLGEAFRNPTAEGYGAIGQGYARDYYKQLSEILGKYSEPKKQLISNYENLSRELDIFKTGAGQKATAVERFDPESYKTYASELPANYFANRESVRDLIELTGGDRRFVEQQAASYVARQLEGIRTPQSAANWEMSNRDWLVEFPGLQGAVNRYLDSLGFAERRVGRTADVAKALRTEISRFPEVAQKRAGEVLKAGEREAAELERPGRTIMGEARVTARETEAAANAKARLLSSLGKDPVIAFDELIRKGNTDRLRAAAPVINRDPDLRRQFLEGVRISISRLDPKEMADNYRRVIQPALQDVGLLDANQARQIAEQVRLVELTVTPDRRGQAIANAIRNVVTGSAGAATSRGMEALGLSFTQPFLGGM